MINNFPVKTIIKLSQTEPVNDNDDDDYHLLQLLLGDEERRGQSNLIYLLHNPRLLVTVREVMIPTLFNLQNLLDLWMFANSDYTSLFVE